MFYKLLCCTIILFNFNLVLSQITNSQNSYTKNQNNKITTIKDVEINVSGPRELLDKFGGTMKIDDYRKNSKIMGREYHKLVPPFLPINFGFEEITNSKTNKNTNLSNLIYSTSKNDNVVIKRNKPLNNVISRQIDYYVVEK